MTNTDLAVPFDKRLQEFGVDDIFEAGKYRELLDAKRPVVITVWKDEQTVEMVDDHVTQLQALKLLSRIRKRFDDKKEQQINIFKNKIFIVKSPEINYVQDFDNEIEAEIEEVSEDTQENELELLMAQIA